LVFPGLTYSDRDANRVSCTAYMRDGASPGFVSTISGVDPSVGTGPFDGYPITTLLVADGTTTTFTSGSQVSVVCALVPQSGVSGLAVQIVAVP